MLKSLRCMQNSIKPTACLDLDGPIIDVSIRHYRVYEHALTILGGTPIPLESFWGAKRQKISDREILAQSGLQAAAEQYDAIKLRLIESPDYLEHDRLQRGVLDILGQIMQQYHIVLVTLRRSRIELCRQLDYLGISSMFNKILSSAAGEKTGWETKCDLVVDSGISPTSEGFFAGDTETDILAGKKLGFSTIAVCNGIRDEKLLRLLSPNWVIPALIDLPSTRFI